MNNNTKTNPNCFEIYLKLNEENVQLITSNYFSNFLVCINFYFEYKRKLTNVFDFREQHLTNNFYFWGVSYIV